MNKIWKTLSGLNVNDDKEKERSSLIICPGQMPGSTFRAP